MEGIDRPVQMMGTVLPPTDEKTIETHTIGVDNSSDDEKHNEKHGATFVGVEEADGFASDQMAGLPFDPFVPFDDLPEEQHRIITIRAVFVGCCCGALVGASNIYLGLKTGWTFTANLFGAIIGFAVIKSISKAVPESFPILGGKFGPRENNIVQTAATAAGGLSSVFISGIPALYQLDLLSTPKEDFSRLICLTVIGAYFGFAFATPLRKFFIIYVARELKLIFPTPTATALTIRSMHMAGTGEYVAKLKMKALAIAFSGALILRVVSQYAVGILWDWHIFTWFFIWSGYKNQALAIENWTWLIEFTPAFIGSGMIVGLNTAISFFGGSVLAWGIIGPALVHQNMAFGLNLGYDPPWDGLVTMMSLGKQGSNVNTPSPRYWLLWPGVLLMIVVSFTELFLQWRIFYFVSKAIWRGSCAQLNAVRQRLGKPSSPYLERNGAQKEDDLVEDIVGDDQLVKWWMWLPLLVVVIICGCVVMAVQFEMPVGESLLAIFLAFFFAFMAVQCTGVTDVTPLTAASKASQIILGGATKGEGWSQTKAARLNLLGGSLASMGANQASDLVSDFRVGFLLRTPPNQQWVAQGVGTLVAIFLAPALFVLFTTAYPCVLDPSIENCPFGGPSISAWRAVTVAMTATNFPVPTSSGIFSVVFSAFGAIMVCIRHYAYTGRFEKYRVYHPNMMCIGLAFVLPYTVYSTAMLMGAILSYVWAKRSPRTFDIYGFAIAAGFIAGEGIGGFINAIFEIAGISGTYYGSGVACPAGVC